MIDLIERIPEKKITSPELRFLRGRHSIYRRLLCMCSMYVFCVCIPCMYSMYVFHVCIPCMYSMYVFHVCMASHESNARSCQELPGAARSCQELPGATRTSSELPGAARSYQGAFWESKCWFCIDFISKTWFWPEQCQYFIGFIRVCEKKKCCGCSAVGRATTALQPQMIYFRKCWYFLGSGNILRQLRGARVENASTSL
mgnify:CR=1 FL=1